MTKAETAPTVGSHKEAQAAEAFEAYCLAVGRVAHAWNYLQQKLGQLFVFVTKTEPAIALSIWYSTDNDRAQRNMLNAAILATKDDSWLPRLPSAKSDLLWVVDRVNAIADLRNNAIHAPASLLTDSNGPSMKASLEGYINGHPRARRLWGKNLLTEFDWCEKSAEALSRFIGHAAVSLNDDEWPWPERPSLPTLGQKKILPSPPRQQPPRSRQRRSQSSPA